MKLLIDAGNTRIKWACVNGDIWSHRGALPVEQAGELMQQFAGVSDLQQIWASNVAGEEVAQYIRNIKAGQINFVVAREMQCGVRNGYSNAGQLGSDRWAALIAAWHLVHAKCMVVNCGTAITIDTLSEQGKFLGGLILPGVDLMQRSLVAATDQLRLEQGKYAAFPLNSADAMYSGAIQACCGAIERQYALLGDDSAPVVLSGGAAGVLLGHLRHVTDKTTSQSTRRANNARQVTGYGEASRLREELQGGRTGGPRPTGSWPHINLPLNVLDDLVLQGLLLISQEAGA
jgi:type III pantothenate kinase